MAELHHHVVAGFQFQPLCDTLSEQDAKRILVLQLASRDDGDGASKYGFGPCFHPFTDYGQVAAAIVEQSGEIQPRHHPGNLGLGSNAAFDGVRLGYQIFLRRTGALGKKSFFINLQMPGLRMYKRFG